MFTGCTLSWNNELSQISPSALTTEVDESSSRASGYSTEYHLAECRLAECGLTERHLAEWVVSSITVLPNDYQKNLEELFDILAAYMINGNIYFFWS